MCSNPLVSFYTCHCVFLGSFDLEVGVTNTCELAQLLLDFLTNNKCIVPSIEAETQGTVVLSDEPRGINGKTSSPSEEAAVIIWYCI